PVTAEIPVSAGHSWLIEVAEQGNDAAVEILDATGRLLAHTDWPESRLGVQRAVIAPSSPGITVRVSGQEESTGSARVRAFDMDRLSSAPQCRAVFISLAAADRDFASTKQISTGHATSTTSAREGYQKSLDGYLAAERALADPADQVLRGYAEIAIAELA